MATLTLTGIERIAKNLAGLNPFDPYRYIAIGSGTGEEYDDVEGLETEITGNGLERTEATCEYISPFKIRWSHTFTATGSETISEVGIFNDVSPVCLEMFLRHVFTPISVYSGDEVEVIITHTME